MIRFVLFLLAILLFLVAGLISATTLEGLNPHTLTYFGLASLAAALTPAPPVGD